MPSLSAEAQRSLDAASVAVLAVRASTLRRDSPSAVTYTLAGVPAPLTGEQLAQTLAARPKPLELQAELAGAQVLVRAVALLSSGAGPSGGSPTGFLRRHYGAAADRLQVVCHGAGELLWTPLPSVEAWDRDYLHINGGGFAADFIDSRLAHDLRAQMPDPRGAAAIIDFGWAGDETILGFGPTGELFRAP